MSTENRMIFATCYGWTDVINCLPLLLYYAQNKDLTIYYLISVKFKNLLDYNIKSSKNIKLLLFDEVKDANIAKLCIQYDFRACISILEILNFKYIPSELNFIGWYDEYREDKYKNIFTKNFHKDPPDFVNLYYSSYDVDPMERLNFFNLDRDLDLENRKYEEFIAEFGDKYILHHHIPECIKDDNNIKYINLAERTDTFYDYVKILENAIEIHLLDSVWGAVCYLLDAKYKLFQNKKIFLYARRGCYKMFVSPIELPNWTIIK